MRFLLKFLNLQLLLTTAFQITPTEARSSEVAIDKNDDHCQQLPPFSKPKNEVNIDLRYLVTQEKFLDNFTTTSNAVLVLGNTGSGKTTVTQILAGNLTRLHAVLAPGDRLVIIDEDDRIGAPSTKSKTLIPEQVLKTSSVTNQTEFSFYDCPGFADTRGPVEDIAANFFMNKVTTKIKNVKMLFLVTHSSVKTGNDRIDFDSLAKHATTFVKSIKKFRNSFALIVTKVNSFNSRGGYISDQKIIDEIVDFLKNYNQTLHSKLASDRKNEKDLTMRKIFFVASLLEQNFTTGKHSKIWFVRSPDCGPLSESNTIREAKANITNLYRQLEYASVDPENDFSFTLKEHSTEYVGNLTDAINMEIIIAVDLVTKSLKERHFNTKIQPYIVHHLVSNIYNELQRIVDALNSEHVALESENSSDGFFLQAIRSIWGTFGEILPYKFERYLEWQEQYLSFLARVTQRNKNTFNRGWATPLLNLMDSSIEKRDWYEFLTHLQEYASSFNFQSQSLQPAKVSDPSLWLKYIQTRNPLLITERIKGIVRKSSEADLDLLHVIMQFSTMDANVTCTNTGTVIQANFFKISSIRNHIRKCSTSTQKLYVYAAHTIFFDEQVTLTDTDAVLISPIFKSPGTVVNSFILEGRSAEPIVPSRAKDGDNGQGWSDRNGKNGMSGRAGLPGSPGGAFFGLVESADSVLVVSKGGNGGNAQDGGYGGSATRGDVSCRAPPDKIEHITESFPCGIHSCLRPVQISSHSGYDGGNGGNGGDGGTLGFGGKSSQIRTIELTQVSKLVPMMLEGELGKPGKGGGKGWGSPKANGYEKFRKECSKRDAKNKRDGSNGRDGSSNSSTLELRYPASSRQLTEWPHLIQYKLLFF